MSDQRNRPDIKAQIAQAKALVAVSPQMQKALAQRIRKNSIARPFSPEEIVALRARGKVEALKSSDQDRSWSTPTQQRMAKEPYGWDTTEHTGGQRSYRVRGLLDTHGQHLHEEEKRALERVIEDAETATRVNLISQRGYNGMPHPGDGSGRAGHITQAQRDAHSRFFYARQKLHPGIWKVIEMLALAKRVEKLNRAMTADEVGRLSTKYNGKDTPAAAAVGMSKIAALAVSDRYDEWEQDNRKRTLYRCPTCDMASTSEQCPECGQQSLRKERYRATDHQEQVRVAYEHGRAVERWEQQASKKR